MNIWKIIACCVGLWPVLVNAETLIPEEIAVPSEYHSVLTLHARGEQIYQCVSQQNVTSWQWQRPDAPLFNMTGDMVGHHDAGPEWRYQDGSRVTGRMLKKLDTTPNTAVAWLLLDAVSHHGQGVFTSIEFIQRVKTRGGLPPISGCDNNHVGMERPVAYSADYIFYRR